MADEPTQPESAEGGQSFGKRRSEEPEPAIDPGKPPIKRSTSVSLGLLVSAATVAVVLGQHDASQREEDVLVYADADACIAAKVRSESDCRAEYAKAQAAYPGGAPRYPTMSQCEAHHGAGHCVAGESVSESLRGQFVPRMAAYFVGRTAEQAVESEPVYEHQPRSGSSSGYGGYCRGSGAHFYPASGGRSSSARMSSASLGRTSFGGFGGTGRSFSSSSSAHGSSGG